LAQSTQRRFQRWLYNPRINVQRLYSPLIQGVLAQWQEDVLYLSLDTTNSKELMTLVVCQELIDG
jgi:hypothetical protein